MADGTLTLKVCGRCGQAKPETSFWFANSARGYRHPHCSECQSLKRKTLYQGLLMIPCTVPGCTRGRVQKKDGLCAMHRSRLKATGSVGPSASYGELNSGPCKVYGCRNLSRTKNLCQTHYNRFMKYGDPLGVSEWTRIRTEKRARRDGYLGSGGYWFVHKNGRRMAEHRHVMEQKLGRELRQNENVHHINGKRDDNRPDNLELWVKSQPSGQRPEDLVAWAREIIATYGEEVMRHRKRPAPENKSLGRAPANKSRLVG